MTARSHDAVSKRMTAFGLVILALATFPAPADAQGFPPDSFTNLKVLPQDIATNALVGTMRNFAIGLGVRCEHCHMGQPGQPLATFDFASDEKPTKLKAREMLRMVQDINQRILPSLPERSEPNVEVACATCHRGLARPRMIEDVLLEAYDEGGSTALRAKYDELRERYYGGYSYDFSEQMLIGVAQRVAQRNQIGDAVELFELNLKQFPNSRLTKFNYVPAALELAAIEGGGEMMRARHAELKGTSPPQAFRENMLNQVGYRLLGQQRIPEAIEAFKLNVEQFPDAFNTYDSLGEAYMIAGERGLAIQNYEKSLELNPQNTNAVEKLKELGRR
jgi:tetratricopeptide (TPR) repeat protein